MNIYKDNRNIRIVAIVGHPKQYGFGHYNRIKLLQQYYVHHSITMDVFFLQRQYSPLQQWNLTDDFNHLVIQDARDTAFPFCLSKIKSIKKTIAIDNQGQGRQQTNLPWDTLPHFNMTIFECKQSLQRTWIPLDIKKLQTQNTQFQIELFQDTKHISQNTFYHYHKDFSTPYLSRQEYLKQLLRADNVSTYFGQTMFESLFLGKRVLLHSISEYHEKLHHFLIYLNETYPAIYKYLDGNGYSRFIEMTKQLILSK